MTGPTASISPSSPTEWVQGFSHVSEAQGREMYVNGSRVHSLDRTNVSDNPFVTRAHAARLHDLCHRDNGPMGFAPSAVRGGSFGRGHGNAAGPGSPTGSGGRIPKMCERKT